MKSIGTYLLFIGCIFLFSQTGSAQIAYGIEPFCVPSTAYPVKKLPSQTLRDLLRESNPTLDPSTYCLGENVQKELAGLEADFDGDGNAEILFEAHGGSLESGCNSLIIAREEVNRAYKLVDLFNVAPGEAATRQLRLLPKGLQIYAQSRYRNDDGATETKGAFFAFEREALLPLISWITKDAVIDGKRVVTDARCAISDFDYHGVKEIFLKITTYEPGAGKPGEKNIIEEHVLTLQFLATQYRYVLYDSSGYDKIREADDLIKSGARLLYNRKVADEGVVKLKNALAMDPFRTDARITLGRYYLRIGKIADAELTFAQAIEMDPAAPEAYAFLGDTYIKINDLQRTLDNYRKYLELNPDGREAKRLKRIIKQITIPKRSR